MSEKNIADLPEDIQNILYKGKRLVNNWWDAWSPISEADSDRNYGRKNPNNNNFKRRALRTKLANAKSAIEAAGFEPRTNGGRPNCAIYRAENNPDWTVLIIGMFNASFGNWDSDGNFQKTFSVEKI